MGLVGSGPPRARETSRAHDGAQEESPPLSGDASEGFWSWEVAGRPGDTYLLTNVRASVGIASSLVVWLSPDNRQDLVGTLAVVEIPSAFAS